MNENLLKSFAGNNGATAGVIAKSEIALQWPLPVDYKDFLKNTNGGEGFVGENYLILWTAEELAQFNNEYQVKDYAPGLVLFGSDGGGEGYAFDTRTIPAPIVRVPFIGMDLAYIRPMADSFSEFLNKLAEKS
ncbi:SMI1/KNR4 family protein [Acidovorax facilis]|uniref:SMI1/KNR4 family protein n=1 Tax=Acidovorax facilis TaxID=12917 RepID=UPI003CF1B50B